jgi:hypothetical protein
MTASPLTYIIHKVLARLTSRLLSTGKCSYIHNRINKLLYISSLLFLLTTTTLIAVDHFLFKKTS